MIRAIRGFAGATVAVIFDRRTEVRVCAWAVPAIKLLGNFEVNQSSINRLSGTNAWSAYGASASVTLKLAYEERCTRCTTMNMMRD